MLTQIYGVDHVGVLVGDGVFHRELPVSKAAAVMPLPQRPPENTKAEFDRRPVGGADEMG